MVGFSPIEAGAFCSTGIQGCAKWAEPACTPSFAGELRGQSGLWLSAAEPQQALKNGSIVVTRSRFFKPAGAFNIQPRPHQVARIGQGRIRPAVNNSLQIPNLLLLSSNQ